MKVKLVDISNNPIEKIYRGYRVCYSKDSYDDVKIPNQKEMIRFIKPLITKGHLSPLEQVSVTFSIEGISRACANQLVRHRTGKFNQASQRYIDGNNFEFAIPESIGKVINLRNRYECIMKEIMELYDYFIENGVKKEDARYILPNATTTRIIFTIDLRNFRNFLTQRLCNHAQNEIRVVARLMVEQIKEHISFIDYEVMNCGKSCKDCFKK